MQSPDSLLHMSDACAIAWKAKGAKYVPTMRGNNVFDITCMCAMKFTRNAPWCCAGDGVLPDHR